MKLFSYRAAGSIRTGPASKPPADSASIKRLKDEIVYPSVRDIDPAVGVGYGRGCGQGAIVVPISAGFLEIGCNLGL